MTSVDLAIAERPRAVAPPVLSIKGLTIAFPGPGGPRPVVRDAGLTIAPGEIAAVIGESGSGKTMLARAVIGLLPPGARVLSGSMHLNGTDLRACTPTELRRLRGAAVGMIFQEPMTSLNPAIRVGDQLIEALQLHSGLDRRTCLDHGLEMLERVQIPNASSCLTKYPHEFSGGMRQRLMIASVLLTRPSLLLADEPTTALDRLVQKEVLDILAQVTRDLGTAVMLITHDLALAAQYAGRVAVMRHGQVLEEGRSDRLLLAPTHDYTRQLLAALPRRRTDAGVLKPTEPLVRAEGLRVEYGRPGGLFRKADVNRVLDGVGIEIAKGEVLALVGESGSGKSTLGRALLRLTPAASGQVRFGETDVLSCPSGEMRRMRRRMQIIFQDPFSALDPRMRIGAIVGEGLRHIPDLSPADKAARIRTILDEVGLGPEMTERFPHELSGGQRQRVSIARALILEPDFVVADEPVAALDISVQAQVLALLQRLQARRGFSCLFISHDLGVVEQIADRVAVMQRGRIVELAPTAALFDSPRHPYTRRLLEALPDLIPAGSGFALGRRDVPAAPCIPTLRYAAPEDAEVELLEIAPGHHVACTPMDHTGGPS